MFAIQRKSHWDNAWWADPVILGQYPEDGVRFYGSEMPKFPSRDMEEIRQPLDYIGLNIYTADTYRMGPDGKPLRIPHPPGYPRSAVDWQPIVPASLY